MRERQGEWRQWQKNKNPTFALSAGIWRAPTQTFLLPRGVKPEPWPEWLSKTFVNLHFLLEDPINLRQDLFGCGRHPNDTWGLVSNLLYAIEHEAKKVLEDDGRRYVDGLTEEGFEDFYLGQSNTPRQANAIAALRSIEVIRKASHAVNPHGYYLCDPHHKHTYDTLTVARLIMETTVLIMAAIRGELWEEVWPHIVESEERKTNLKSNSEKAVLVKRLNAHRRKDLWRRLASKSKALSTRGKALYVRKNWPRNERPRPALGTVYKDLLQLPKT